jgi:hypothetical protein
MTTTLLTPQVDIRREDERFKTNISWLDSRHVRPVTPKMFSTFLRRQIPKG